MSAVVGSRWWMGLPRAPATVNGGMGLSACMDRAVVVARVQLEKHVSSTVLLRPWWAC